MVHSPKCVPLQPHNVTTVSINLVCFILKFVVLLYNNFTVQNNNLELYSAILPVTHRPSRYLSSPIKPIKIAQLAIAHRKLRLLNSSYSLIVALTPQCKGHPP